MFLVMAMTKSLDAVILDPCDKRIMANLITTITLLGKDAFCKNSLTAFQTGEIRLKVRGGANHGRPKENLLDGAGGKF